jgi:hypothetical protein
MTQGPPSPFDVALARIRALFAHHQQAPTVLTHSLELEDRTRDASRAAVGAGMPLVAACAEFGRAAAESFPTDRLVAIAIGRTMTRWAAEVYHRAPAVDSAVS